MGGQKLRWEDKMPNGGTRFDALQRICGTCPIDEGARRLGLSVAAVRQHCYRHGVKWMRGWDGSRVSRDEVAKMCGTYRQRIYEVEKTLGMLGRGSGSSKGSRARRYLDAREVEQIKKYLGVK